MYGLSLTRLWLVFYTLELKACTNAFCIRFYLKREYFWGMGYKRNRRRHQSLL